MFWAIAGLVLAATTILLARPLLLRGEGVATTPDIEVYRDQLKEVERDLERGVLRPEEADALKTEISRRLLAAADEGGVAKATSGASPTMQVVGIGLVVAMIGVGVGTYLWRGSPGLPDQPLAARLEADAERRAARPTQAEAVEMLAERVPEPVPDPEDERTALIARLSEVLETRPDDLRGHQLLADSLAGMGRFREASAAQGEVLRILAAEAGPDDFIAHAELQILAVNGYVSPEAEASLQAALQRRPTDPRARYYSGLAALQAGRVDITYDLWVRLLAEGPPDAPWVQSIAQEIGEVALQAGRPVPTVPTGPTGADIAAASGMSAEERQEMIRGMVEGLDARLTEEGGPAAEWARLIRAYGVLRETAQASDAWQRAQEAYADDPVALGLLRQAARDAEVAQ